MIGHTAGPLLEGFEVAKCKARLPTKRRVLDSYLD